MTLLQLLTMLFQGLTGASFLALVTLAIVLIFRTSFTTNFAQGAIATFSAYAVTVLFTRFFLVQFPNTNPIILLVIAMIISVFIGFLMGLMIDVFIIRRSKYSNPITKQMITMGMIMVISGMIPLIYGINLQPVPRMLSLKILTVNVGGIVPLYLPMHNIISIVVTIIVISIVFLALKHTKWGLGVRATASNETVANMMGVNTKFITAMSWGIAGGLGAIASALYAPTIFNVGLDIMVPLQINGFLAGVLGGFSTFGGPIVAAIIIASNQNPMKTALGVLNTQAMTVPVFSSYVNADPTAVDTETTYGFDIYTNAWLDVTSPTSATELAAFESAIDGASFLSAAEKDAYKINAFAIAGYVAGSLFVDGLKRVGTGTLTWESYIKAIESAPWDIPMGGTINFANGQRIGITDMSLLKYELIQGDNPLTTAIETKYAAFVLSRPIENLDDIRG